MSCRLKRGLMTADGTVVGCFEDGVSIVLSPSGGEAVRVSRNGSIERDRTCSCRWRGCESVIAFRNAFAAQPFARRTRPEVVRWRASAYGGAAALWTSARFRQCALRRLGILSYKIDDARVSVMRPLESWSRDDAYAALAALAISPSRNHFVAAALPTSGDDDDDEDASLFYEIAYGDDIAWLREGYPALQSCVIEWRRNVGVAWSLGRQLIECRPCDVENVEYCRAALVLDETGVCREARLALTGEVVFKSSTFDALRKWPAWRGQRKLFDLLAQFRAQHGDSRGLAHARWWWRVAPVDSRRHRCVVDGLATLDYKDGCARGVFLDGTTLVVDGSRARVAANRAFDVSRPPPSLVDHVALVADFYKWAVASPEDRLKLRLDRKRADRAAKIALQASRRFVKTLGRRQTNWRKADRDFLPTPMDPAKYMCSKRAL